MTTLGCSHRPSRVQAVDVDPDTLSERLVAEYDSDGNGALSDTELKGIPPIYDSRSQIDSDTNGELSTQELEIQLTKVFNHQVGVLPARCKVTRNGRPLAGAEVRFVPPELLNGVLPPANGVTNNSGVALLRLAPEDMPDNIPNPRMAVMRPGIYLVEVTHPEVDIPAEYNTKTKLGKLVYSAVLNGPPLSIELEM